MFYNSLPRRSHLYRKLKSSNGNFIYFRDIRKRQTKSYWNLMYTMWFFIFLTFVIKIGQIWPIQFTDFTNFMISYYSKGLSLPHVPNSREGTSSRHWTFITIDKQGRYLIDGKFIEPEELDNFLSEARVAIGQNKIILLDQDSEYFVAIDSLTIFALLIDKNCEMETVYKLFQTLRKNGFNKIFLIAPKI